MPEFFSKDKHFGCRLIAAHVEQLRRLALEAWPDETGGILIGYYTDNLNMAVITNVEPPPEDSVHGRFSFVRGVRGLATKLRWWWAQPPADRRYFLGEWHTHPGDQPRPSPQDCREMSALSRSGRARCPEPLLLIVGGEKNRLQIGAYVFPRGHERLELYPEPAPSEAGDASP